MTLFSNNIFIEILMLAICADMLLGVLRAIKFRQFNSSVGIDGAIRKVAMVVSVGILMLADLLIHVVDISHPDFEEQISVVDKTIADLEAGGKPTMIVFNKIDAYTYIEKAEDDLTPKTRENITLEELMKTWMAKLNDNCIFISAREKINMDELKTIIYNKVRELHVQKYPYNDFLYQTYDEE